MNKKCQLICIALLVCRSFFACTNDNSGSEQNSRNAETGKSDEIIKGISAASIYDPLKQKGFSIDNQFGSDIIFVNCDKSSSEATEHVRIAGIAPEKIIEIKASYTNYTSRNTDELAKPFLGFIATLPYEGSIPDNARKWLEQNISKNSKTNISSVDFEVIANLKNMRTLLITPKK